MNACCDKKSCGDKDNENNSLPRKFICPINQKQYIEVAKKTILQHIKAPWKNKLDEQKYYFCDDPDCNVVYFGLNGSIINKSELRTVVGKKEKSDNELICYCFGVSKSLARKNPEIKTYVTQQTKENNCSCDVKNPSGRCCLKDFPKSFN